MVLTKSKVETFQRNREWLSVSNTNERTDKIKTEMLSLDLVT